MHPQISGPGTTTPKLLENLLAFDPLRGVPNILTDFPPPHGEGRQLAPQQGSCKHQYTTKFNQSVTSEGSTERKLAIVCTKCRLHAEIWVNCSNSVTPCPHSTHPLHHFQREPFHDESTQERIRFAWQCSIQDCQATLLVLYRKPRLSDKPDIALLTNPELLKRRYDAILEEEPNRDGVRLATPIEPLARLRRYIIDSLNPTHNKRQFPANNKRFQEAFGLHGGDCRQLLERLGFKYAVSSLQEGQDADWDLCGTQEFSWVLPNPDEIPDRLQADGSSHREFLEDVEIELHCWMAKLSAEFSLVNPTAGETLSSANRDIERVIAAQGCKTHCSSLVVEIG